MTGPTKETNHSPAKLATNTFAGETSPKAGVSSNFFVKVAEVGIDI